MFNKTKSKQRLELNNGHASEVETLQNALQEAMLRERQLIQEKAQREDEMAQQRDAMKKYIGVMLKEKAELEQQQQQQPPSSSQPVDTSSSSSSKSSAEIEQLQNVAEQSKNDLQRVLQKLSQREHEHGQLSEEVAKLRTALKERSAENAMYKTRVEETEKSFRITKDKLETTQQKIERATQDQQQFHETKTLLASITNELRTVNEKNKIIQQEKENLRDELAEKTNLLSELQSKLDQMALENTNYSGRVQELSVQMEELSTKGKHQIDELLSAAEESKQEIEALSANISTLQNEQQEQAASHEQEMKAASEQMEELTRERVESEEALNATIQEKEAQLKEYELDASIKEKKKNKLLKELQDQLKVEVIKSQELKCKVLNLSDELLDLKQKNEALQRQHQQQQQQQQQSTSSTVNNSHLDIHSLDDHHDHLLNRSASRSGSFVEVEVSAALSKKLESEVQANYALKEQIRYLAETIQQLHIDLDNKKTVINNLTKRISIGALPTDTAASSRTRSLKNSHANVSQLNLLMQETTLQNAMLRKDLATMGNALQDATKQINTLQTNKSKQEHNNDNS